VDSRGLPRNGQDALLGDDVEREELIRRHALYDACVIATFSVVGRYVHFETGRLSPIIMRRFSARIDSKVEK
jgi:hypothetical protein